MQTKTVNFRGAKIHVEIRPHARVVLDAREALKINPQEIIQRIREERRAA